MWIRPDRVLLARMPSMRPQPSAAVPAKPAQSAPTRKPAPVEPPPAASADEQERADGGFHESSYELRTGMDVIESEWPEDTTIPGALDEG